MTRRAPLAVAVVATLLGAAGTLAVRSASWQSATGTYGPEAANQVVWLALALVACGVTATFPWRRLVRAAPLLYALALVLLVGLFVAGELRSGARSWYRFGPVRVQPAEPAKLALVLACATALARFRDVRSLAAFLAPLALLAPPFLLVAAQPDLGSAVALVPPVGAMLLVAGARLRHFAALVGLGVMVAGGALAVSMLAPEHGVLEAHQLERVESFLHPERDPQGAGFQAMQARIAIGAGGLRGAGYGQGSQTQLGILPDSHTDFVFAAIAEEGGFVGASAIVLAFAALVILLAGIAHRTAEPAARLVVVGVLSLLGGQAFLNMGVASGLLPIAGITLPFLSYGGSSLVTSFAAIGLAMNAGRQRRAPVSDDLAPRARAAHAIDRARHLDLTPRRAPHRQPPPRGRRRSTGRWKRRGRR